MTLQLYVSVIHIHHKRQLVYLLKNLRNVLYVISFNNESEEPLSTTEIDISFRGRQVGAY